MPFSGYKLPRPADWQKFERLCRDLWAKIWRDPNAHLHGRNGQPQHGVDVYGQPAGQIGVSAVQCKRREDGSLDPGQITEGDLRAEVQKARRFSPPIKGAFILATTAPRDTKLQAFARKLSEEHAALGLFRVDVWAWDDIEEALGEHPDVFAHHYSDIAASIRQFGGPSLIAPGAVGVAIASHGNSLAVTFDFATVLEGEHRAHITEIRALLKRGHPQLALEQALALKTRVWSGTTELARAHLLVLVGQATLELGNEQPAAHVFFEALDHAPLDPTVQAHVALGYLLTDQREQALDWAGRTLAQLPDNIIAIQVVVLLDERPDSDLFNAYSKLVGPRYELYCALGHKALRRGDHAGAQDWLEKAAALNTDSADVAATLAQVVLERTQVRLDVRFHLSAEATCQVTRALELFELAWGKWLNVAVRRSRVNVIVGRTIAKRLLGTTDAAASADEVLAVGGEEPSFLLLRAAIAADAGDFRKTAELLDRISDPSPDVRGLRATAKANLGRPADSLEDWTELLAMPELESPIREQAEANFIRALLDVDPDRARTTISRWILKAPPTLLVLSWRSRRLDASVTTPSVPLS
jgi:tetratricopeptide (TPR) repeat protein